LNSTSHLPAFIITIDTEGDNLWAGPNNITTKNALYLPRFQRLCEKHGFKPTYLTNYEMAIDPHFIAFGKDVVQRNTAEIGMHLHAWNSPPIKPISDHDNQCHPYLIEFDREILIEKVTFMTELLESTFECKMTSHRAGRWAFNDLYAQTLKELGYLVDCSVTPGMSWKKHSGSPKGNGGSDYSNFPSHAYKMDIHAIAEVAKSDTNALLEVPMTVVRKRKKLGELIDQFLPDLELIKKVNNKISPIFMFRSQLGNLNQLRWAVKNTIDKGSPYLEYMLHSSEFMPEGSPNYTNEEEIEDLYRDLEDLFTLISKNFQGMTLTEYYFYQNNSGAQHNEK